MAPKHLGGDWLSSEQAAAMLGVNTRTLYRRIDEGEIDAYRMGRVIRLRREDVELLIRRSKIRPEVIRRRATAVSTS